MADIRIKREHSLGLESARKLAFQWAEAAEQRLEMACTYEEGKTSDLVSFTRSGVNGELKVTADAFELNARLGMLLGVFKGRIEEEIVKNLDLLLEQQDPHAAFQHAVEKRAPKEKKPAPARKATPGKKPK